MSASDLGSHEIAVAYYYFDFTDTSKQTSSDLLRSILSQITLENPQAYEVTSQLYTSCRMGSQQPTVQDLLNSVKKAAATFEHLYIIIDAIDESPRDTHRESVLDVVCELRKHGSLHIAAASRKEIDITNRFSCIGATEVKVSGPGLESDIRRYISSQFMKDTRLMRIPKGLKDEAQVVLSKKANGM